MRMIFGALALILAPGVASGQTIDHAEIVVTAQKRPRAELESPVAVTVLGPADISSGFGQSADLQRLAPSLAFSPGSQPQTSTFAIRGVATFSASDALDRSVGLVMDDVGAPGSLGTNVDLVDVERVEVLRGPQGTLFGESATAGLIQVLSTKPAFTRTGRIAVGAGSHDERRFEGVLNLGGQNLAGRAVVWQFRRDGIVSAPHQIGDLGDKNDAGARLRLRWTRGEAEANLIVEGAERDARGVGATHRSYQGFSFSPALQARDLANGVVAGPTNYSTSADGRSADKQIIRLATLNYESALAGQRVSSITSWRLVRASGAFDPDYSDSVAPAPDIYLFNFAARTEQISQEFRLASAEGAPLDYVIGAAAQVADFDSDQQQAALRLAPVPLARNVQQDIRKITYAIFADLSAPLSASWRVLGGMRGSKDSAKGAYLRAIPAYGVPVPLGPFSNFQLAASLDHSDWAGRLGLQYSFPTGGIAYVTVSRANKAPGFNFTADTSASQQAATPLIVAAEIAKSLEVGLKHATADGKVRFNATYFYTLYDDFQGTSSLPTIPLSFVTINAERLRTQGVELEGQWRPIQGFTLSAQTAYLDAEFDRFPNAPCFAGQTAVQGCRATPTGPLYDVSGTSPPNAPRWTGSVTGHYEAMVHDRLRAFLEAQAYFKGRVHFGLGDNPADVEKAFAFVNVAVGVESAARDLRVVLRGRNVFDRSFADRLTPNNGAIVQIFSPESRAYYGLTVEKTF